MTKKRNDRGGACLAFAERNIKELLRSPVGWAFGLALPVGLFVIMQIIIKSIGSDAADSVPMFGVARFTGGAIVFGASFLGIFAPMLISGDRQSSFLSRLFVSPMSSSSFIIGYALGVMPIAAAQIVVTFCVALCFGLPPTPYILLAALFAAVILLLFVDRRRFRDVLSRAALRARLRSDTLYARGRAEQDLAAAPRRCAVYGGRGSRSRRAVQAECAKVRE